ncbi:MAG: AbrB/MazE/SpoVT family DNA-binding domain-containing protein [bacterium]
MSRPLPDVEACFYGSATLGERGQIVVPAEARKDCDIHPGDKLLVFRHPMHPGMLVISKFGDMQEFIEHMKRTADAANRHMTELLANPDDSETEKE